MLIAFKKWKTTYIGGKNDLIRGAKADSWDSDSVNEAP